MSTTPKNPEYAPTCGNIYRWVLAAAQAIRASQQLRIAESIERINSKAGTNGIQR